MPKRKKQKMKTARRNVLLFLLLAAAAVYVGGVFYYHSHFLRGTVIDQIDVSNMTVQELTEQVQNYSLQITERQSDGAPLEETIAGKDISLEYSSAEPLDEILRQQNKWLWFLAAGETHETEELLTYDNTALETQVCQLNGLQDDSAVSPVDASISEYTPENGFQIIAETRGNELDYEQTLEAVSAAVESLTEQIDLEQEGCYHEPQVTSDDEQLQAALEKAQKYTAGTITYTFGENK